MGFFNAHGHTEHSHLDAIIRVKELFKRAEELGQTAVAITDHGVMGGLWEAYNEYKRTGIKFVPGNEIYFSEDLSDPKAKRGHLILLASNEVGYKNLLRLTAASYENPAFIMGRAIPRVNLELLDKYKEGLYATSACMSSLIADGIFRDDLGQAEGLAKALHDIFGDRFFIELQPHKLSFTKKDKKTGQLLFYSQESLNNELIKIATKLGIEMIATCDSHYIVPEHEEYHDMIQAISSKKAISDLNRKRYATKLPCGVCEGHGVFPIDSKTKCDQCQGSGIGKQIPCPEYYLKSEQEIFDFFAAEYNPEFARKLIDNTEKIERGCENPDYIEPNGHRLPTFDMTHISQSSDCDEFLSWREQKHDRLENADDIAYLKFKCMKGFQAYCRDMPKEKKKEYWERVKTEVDVFESRGFCSYMLIVADFMDWARKNDVYVGPGRGSGCGSLVGFLLGIHEVDPLQHGLLFERFVNKFKKDLPDYDLDFESARRHLVYEYVKNKYGEENFAYISNISKITPKVAIKDIARSLQIGGDKSTAFQLANKVTADIPDKVTLPNGKTVEIRTFELAMQYSEELRNLVAEYPEIAGHAKALIGLPRNFSTHAAGVIISDIPLNEYVPLRRDKDGAVAIQYDKYGAEDVGLVKIDFLSLETLDIMRETYEGAKKIGIELPKYNEIPMNDKLAYKLIGSGKVLGLFQLDGGTLSSLCSPMKPRSVDDLASLNALGRPSCSKEDRTSFINRRFRKEKVVPPHELLESVFQLTYGIGLYDEQLQLLAKDVADWDLAKADSLRKLTKMKEKGAALAVELEKDFIHDAKKFSHISDKDAQHIWEDVILPFSGYGFCKAHATAYGLLGYRTAYYKAHALAPFLCAFLNSKTKSNVRGREDVIHDIKKEIKAFKINIAPCDINKSEEYYTVLGKRQIVTGFGAIKGLGAKALEGIVLHQPYNSFEDFLYRTPSSAVNKTAVQALAKAGAFDCLGVSRKFAHDNYAIIRTELNTYVKKLDDSHFEMGDRTRPYDTYLDGFWEHFKARMTKKGLDIPDRNEEWSIKEKMIYEKEVLGEYISGSIDKLFPNFFKGGQWSQSFSAVKQLPKNYPVPMEGLVTGVRELTIKNGRNAGQKFGKLVVENMRGETIDVTVWSEQYGKFKKKFSSGSLPIRGMFKTNEWNGQISLVVDGHLEVYEGQI